MNKFKYLILTIPIFLLCMSKTYAICTDDAKREFYKIEKEFVIKKTLDSETKTYTLEYTNPYPDKYEYLLYGNAIEEKEILELTNTITISNITNGELSLFIKGKINTCDEVIKEYKLTFTKYNEHADDPLCSGYEEFYLCNPEYDKQVDYDTFISRLETYKKSKNKNNKQETVEIPKEENQIITYIKKNLVSIIVIILFTILILITILLSLKSIRQSRRLE